jgi:tripartite-type tricarboxylate transporter receptor subunit TctC
MRDDLPAPSRRRMLAAGAAGLGATLMGPAARADTWPSKPIRFVVSQPPGASTDATARAFAEHFTNKLGVGVSVENRPGAAGMISAELVAHSPPDGYTFLVCLHSQLAQAPVLLKKPPIDPDRDLVPISALTPGVLVAATRPDLGASTIKDVIALSRQRPVTVGNYSIGSGWQMQVSQLVKETGGQFTVVTYKGTSQMLTDLASGQIDIAAGSLIGMTPFLQRNAVRPFLIISEAGSPKLPGIPTWVEAGFTSPAFALLLEYNMLLAPAGTAPEVVAKLAELSLDAGLSAPRIRALRDLSGSESPVLAGDAMRRMIAQVWPVYRTMTRELNLKVE